MNEIELLKITLDWLGQGRQVALVRVVKTWGSAPQPVGSLLIVDKQGNFEGSISGGCVEADVIAEAVELIEEGGHKLVEYGVSDHMAWQVGLACGGTIEVFIEVINKQKAGNLGQVVKSYQGRTAIAIETNLETGDQSLLRKIDANIELVTAFENDVSGVLDGSPKRFLHVFNPALKLIIIGAVHITQALLPLAKQIGFDVSVIDPRKGFATGERFCGARVYNQWPHEVLNGFDLDSRTAFVALTHDPKIDDEALVDALESDCFYIGALGSRKTHAKRLERLKGQKGLERIDAPIGLDIGAKGANEIAVSIIAKIIEARRKGNRVE